jgi:hypothetical protein
MMQKAKIAQEVADDLIGRWHRIVETTYWAAILSIPLFLASCALKPGSDLPPESDRGSGEVVAIKKTDVTHGSIKPITGQQKIGECTQFACGPNCVIRVDSATSGKQVCSCPFGARVTSCPNRDIEIVGGCKCRPCDAEKLDQCPVPQAMDSLPRSQSLTAASLIMAR